MGDIPPVEMRNCARPSPVRVRGFPNEARADDQEMYEKYRSGGFGSKVTLGHFAKHANDQRPLNIKKTLKTLFFLKANK